MHCTQSRGFSENFCDSMISHTTPVSVSSTQWSPLLLPCIRNPLQQLAKLLITLKTNQKHETWLGLCHAKIIMGIFCPHGRGCRSSPKSSTQSPTEAVKHGSRRRGSAGTVCTIWAQPRLRQSTETTYSPLPYGSRDVANQTCPKYVSTRSFKDE